VFFFREHSCGFGNFRERSSISGIFRKPTVDCAGIVLKSNRATDLIEVLCTDPRY